MYAASFSRESQAESPACGQHYKPAQKHSVNIFLTLPTWTSAPSGKLWSLIAAVGSPNTHLVCIGK
jgi:hypothetical protein